VLGLGLMGGSLALGLAGHCRELHGIDPDPDTVAYARTLGVFDRLSTDPSEILPQCNLVILAAPLLALQDLIQKLPAMHPGRAAVIDIGSTKVEIARALEALPERFTAVGGHPMCGKETAGLAHADRAIFQGYPFIFTELANTSTAVRKLADELAAVLDAQPVWLDPDSHDRQVAAASHVPYFLASALVLATPYGSRAVLGSGFRGAARLAGSSPGMMTAIVRTNRANIVEALDRLQNEIIRLTGLVRDEADDELAEALEQARHAYRRFLQAAEE
jgi:prephenate dehydrogenase